MNRHQQFLTSSLAIASLVVVSAISSLLGPPAYAVAINFTSSANVNVLRQYNLSTVTNRVTVVSPGNFRPGGANDGSGYNDERDNMKTSSDTLTDTFTLPSAQTIGSYMVQFETPGTTYEVDYWNGASWQVWDSFNSIGGGRVVRTPGSVTTSQIRTIATGPTTDATNGYYRMFETQVYLATGQTVCLDQGFSYMYDKNPTGTASTTTTGGPWYAPNGGDQTTLKDANFNNNELKAQNPSYGTYRAFMKYDFGSAFNMMVGSLGGSKGQGWGSYPWEVYTTNDPAVFAGLQSLGSGTSAALQVAGWRLQYSYAGGSDQQERNFLFGSPSDYRYAALVWTSQFGGEQELEIFGLPEPTSLSLLALGGLALLRRRR